VLQLWAVPPIILPGFSTGASRQVQIAQLSPLYTKIREKHNVLVSARQELEVLPVSLVLNTRITEVLSRVPELVNDVQE